MSKPSTLFRPSGLCMERGLGGSWLSSRHMPDGEINMVIVQIEQRSLADLQALSRTSNDTDDEGLLWLVESGS